MRNEFTPGPWVGINKRTKKYGSFHGWSADNELASSTMSAPINAGRETIALVVTTDWERRDEHDANARLIAAAPELLATLQEVVRISDHKHDAWNAAKAAIAKATGHE